ncbi:MAG: hypothetical protein DRN78_02825 [Thermoproteota archaeon]|nr:MAG: hypothetical protein DRN78_02825 [Candidatus Korarchaeota archaeon]
MKKSTMKKLRRILAISMALVFVLPMVGVAAQENNTAWPGNTNVLPFNWGSILFGILFALIFWYMKRGEAGNVELFIVFLIGMIFGQFFGSYMGLPAIGFAAGPSVPTPAPSPAPSPSTTQPPEITGTIRVYVKDWIGGSAITSGVTGYLLTPSIAATYSYDPIAIVADIKAGNLRLPSASVTSSGTLDFVGFTAKSPFSEYYLLVVDSDFTSGLSSGDYAPTLVKLQAYPQKDINGLLTVTPGYISLWTLGPGAVINEALEQVSNYTWVYNGTLSSKTFSFTITPDVPSSSNAGKELLAWALYYKIDGNGTFSIDQLTINGQAVTPQKLSDLSASSPLYQNKPDSTYEYVILVNEPGYIRSANNYDSFIVNMEFTSEIPQTNETEYNMVTFQIVPLATGKDLGFTGGSFIFKHADSGTSGWGS